MSGPTASPYPLAQSAGAGRPRLLCDTPRPERRRPSPAALRGPRPAADGRPGPQVRRGPHSCPSCGNRSRRPPSRLPLLPPGATLPPRGRLGAQRAGVLGPRGGRACGPCDPGCAGRRPCEWPSPTSGSPGPRSRGSTGQGARSDLPSRCSRVGAEGLPDGPPTPQKGWAALCWIFICSLTTFVVLGGLGHEMPGLDNPQTHSEGRFRQTEVVREGSSEEVARMVSRSWERARTGALR